MKRRPMVVANWKMETTAAEAVLLARRYSQALERIDDLELVVLPPVIWLPTLVESIHIRPRNLHFGVQNFYPKEFGPYTGETGLGMIKNLAQYVLIGHSERRKIFGESDKLINEKVKTALKAGLHPIFCVGELTKVMLTSRKRGRPTLLMQRSDLLLQLEQALKGVTEKHLERLVVCYEPLWAIGSGQNVSGVQAQAVIERLREYLVDRFGKALTGRIRTIYGGSVSPKTIDEYATQPDIDGVLVGGASLEAKAMLPILNTVGDRFHRTSFELV